MYIKMIVLHRHLQEHMKDFTGDDASLEAKDQDELEFHYFKLHDYDNNNKLGESLYYTQYSVRIHLNFPLNNMYHVVHQNWFLC